MGDQRTAGQHIPRDDRGAMNDLLFFLLSSLIWLIGLSMVFFSALWAVRYAGRALGELPPARGRPVAIAQSMACVAVFFASPIVAGSLWLALLMSR